MSMSDSELIMSKRKREDNNGLIIILRGVPGSGKTTTARALYNIFDSRFYYTVILSRDAIRMQHCGHEFNYQASFRDPVINTKIRDEYFQKMFEELELVKNWPYCCVIIDATNTKVADLKRTFWTINKALSGGRVHFDKYIYTKRHEHRSIHNVPECIMQRFREELKESDEWLKKHSNDFKINCYNKILI